MDWGERKRNTNRPPRNVCFFVVALWSHVVGGDPRTVWPALYISCGGLDGVGGDWEIPFL